MMLFPTLKGFVIFSDFQLNRIAITESECVNIEVDKNCKGTCHFVKEIKKESPEEKKTPFTPSDNTKLELLFFESSNNQNNSSYLSNNSFCIILNTDIDRHPDDIFRPPKSSFLC